MDKKEGSFYVKSYDGLAEKLERWTCDMKRTVQQAQLPGAYQSIENICLEVIVGVSSCTSLYFDIKELVERLKTAWVCGKKMALLINGKKKSKSNNGIDFRYACLSIAGDL